MGRRIKQITAVLAATLIVGACVFVWITTDNLAVGFLTGSKRTPGHDRWGGKVPSDGPTPGAINLWSGQPSEAPPGLRLRRVFGTGLRDTGIEPGDVVLSVDGKDATNAQEIEQGLLRDHLAGEQVSVRFWKQKGGVEEERLVTLPPYLRHPGDLDLEYEDVTLESESGFAIRGWFIPPPEGSDGRSGVFAHGASDSRYHGLEGAKHWHRRGYGLLLMDMHGVGASGGDSITYSVNERHDVVAMIRWLRERGIPSGRIAVYGVSAGGPSAIYGASMDGDIGALALTACSSDMWANTGEALEHMGLSSSLAWPMLWAVERHGGFDMRDIRPIDAIADVGAPVFFIHGGADTLILPYHSERMHAARLAAGLPSERWVLPGVGHQPSRIVRPEEFWDRVLDFYDAAIGPPDPAQ